MQGNGYVLAGGQSRRMGQDKSFLTWRGRPLVERAVELLTSLGLETHIVCASPDQAGRHKGATVVDTILDRGPMGGILTGLLHSGANRNFFVPCDMPLLTKDVLKVLARFAEDYDVVIPSDASGEPQPVVGVYSANCIEPIQRRIHEGRLSLRGLTGCGDVRVKVVAGLAQDPETDLFLNINDPQTLSQEEGVRSNKDTDQVGSPGGP